MTTQAPFEVWLAIPNNARAPHLGNLYRLGPLQIVRFSERALTEGIEEQRIDGVPVRVTNLVLTRYALERLLYRLSQSGHAEHFPEVCSLGTRPKKGTARGPGTPRLGRPSTCSATGR